MTTARMLQIGKHFGYPRVQLAPGTVLEAGESNWQKFLAHPTAEHRRWLTTALQLGHAVHATDPGVLP